jgi:sugar phosphate isomerase/epimerase
MMLKHKNSSIVFTGKAIHSNLLYKGKFFNLIISFNKINKMIRKRILSVAINAGIGLLVAFMMFSCKPAVQKYLGIQLYSVRDSMRSNPKNTIVEVGKMGYKFVEPAGYGDGLFYEMSPADFKALVEANGMTVLSSHTGHNAPDSSNYDAVMAWWDQCIDAHIAAGAKYIVQASMGNDAYASLAGLKKYCDYFNAVGEKCNAKGIRFGYHNHKKEFGQLEGNVIYDYMLQNTDPKKVFFQMDLYWIKEGGGIALDYFKKYPGRFELFHIKDAVELGVNATMDFKPLFENASLAGAKYYIVEVEQYTTGNEIQSIKQSLDFLNKADYVK